MLDILFVVLCPFIAILFMQWKVNGERLLASSQWAFMTGLFMTYDLAYFFSERWGWLAMTLIVTVYEYRLWWIHHSKDILLVRNARGNPLR